MGQLIENVVFNNRYSLNERVWNVIDNYKGNGSKEKIEQDIYNSLLADNIKAKVWIEGIHLHIDIISVDGIAPPERIKYKFILTSYATNVIREAVEEAIKQWDKELNINDMYIFEQHLEKYVSEKLNIDRDKLIIYPYTNENIIVVGIWKTKIHIYIHLIPQSFKFGDVIVND